MSASTLAFGDVTVNTITTKTLTLTSSGTAALTVNSVRVAGTGYVASGTTFPVTLNPGQSVTLQVSFAPNVTGAAGGAITISSNSSSGATNTVTLSGTGTAVLTPQLTLSANALAFGNVTVKTTSTKTLTLTSSGTAALKVHSVTLAGAGFALSGATFPVTLNPGQSMTLQVSFDPTVAGVAGATITISSDSSSGAISTVTLSGTGKAAPTPQLTLSANTLAFGNVTVKTASTKTLTLTSSGTAALKVHSVTLAGAGFALSGATFPVTLNPGQSVTLQVSFDPTVAGAAGGTITISTDSSSGATKTVTLSGTGTAAPTPRLTLSANTLAFGNVTVKTTSTKTLTLTSSGTAALKVHSVTLAGAGFTLSGAKFPVNLKPGQSVTLQVSFDPTVAGAAGGTITISSDSSSGPTNIVTLSGTGTSAPIPQLTLSANTLAFGDVTLKTTSTKTLTLTSSGSAALKVNSVTLAGAGFALSGVTFPATLNPGESVTLRVSFDPTVAGAAGGTITISSNSSSGATNIVTLSGTGTAALTPQLTLSASALAFGNVTVKTTSTKTLTLTSSGSAALKVTSVTLAGAGFALSGATFPATLNPGQSVTLQVSFDPAVAGAAAGTINISSNSSSGATNIVTLSGTGTAAPTPQLTLSASALAFGNVTVKTTSTKTLTLTSSGSGAVKVNSVTLAGAGFALSGAMFPATLNPGQSVTLQVSFDPAVAGVAAGTITISSNSSGGATNTVTLSGTGTASPTPQLTLSASALAFGNVTVKTTSTKTLTLTSSGTAVLTVNSVLLIGTGYAASGATFPVMLNPGQSMTLQVSFDPTVTGAASGTITLSSNASGGATNTVTLSGTGTAAPTPQMTLSASTLAFGNVTLNTTSTKTLTLTSSGTAALMVNSAALIGAGYAISGATFPATLNPGQSVTLQVSFDPTVAGAAAGTITISSNSATGATATVSLSGTGTNPSNPVLTVSTTALNFGDDPVGTTATLSVTLTSTGTSPVTVNAASVTGAGFTFSGATFPVTLNPTIAISIQVQFDPTVVGAASGKLSFASNSTTGTTSVVNLSGNGTAVAHKVSLSWSAPISSPVTVTGYNVYRATGGSTSFALLSSADAQTSYADLSVVASTTYTYYVTSIDSGGAESVSSNQVTVTIP
jgi:hypothetical protein